MGIPKKEVTANDLHDLHHLKQELLKGECYRQTCKYDCHLLQSIPSFSLNLAPYLDQDQYQQQEQQTRLPQSEFPQFQNKGRKEIHRGRAGPGQPLCPLTKPFAGH